MYLNWLYYNYNSKYEKEINGLKEKFGNVALYTTLYFYYTFSKYNKNKSSDSKCPQHLYYKIVNSFKLHLMKNVHATYHFRSLVLRLMQLLGCVLL